MKDSTFISQSHLLLLFIFSACTKNKSSVEYTEPLIKSKIVSYVHALKPPHSKREVLTVILTGKKDTVIMEIANTYPDSTEADIMAHDRIAGHDIFFVGEQRDDFYTIGREASILANPSCGLQADLA